jgi:hypothetical protein
MRTEIVILKNSDVKVSLGRYTHACAQCTLEIAGSMRIDLRTGAG